MMRSGHAHLALWCVARLCLLWSTGASDADPDWFFESLPSSGGNRPARRLMHLLL